jgi:hypothetical protein
VRTIPTEEELAKKAAKQLARKTLMSPVGLTAITVVIFLAIVFALIIGGAQQQASATCTDSSGISSVRGGNNDEVVYNYLVSDPKFHLQPYQAAGVEGNFVHESAGDIAEGDPPEKVPQVNPNIVNGIGATGIGQWYAGRRNALMAHRFQGRKWNDLLLQLDYLRSELLGSQSAALNAVKSASTIEEATTKFEQTFEVSGDYASYPGRIRNAKAILALYGGGAPSSGNPQPSDAGQSCATEAAIGGPLPSGIKVDTSPGKIVPVPGFPGETVDNRILQNLLALVAKYKLKVTDCFSRDPIHKGGGEHPLGLACDLVPGTGGNWDLVDQLAAWAEPSQDHPIPPFRWVGYNGDENHGRGNHLHLSWDHAPAAPFTIAQWVKVLG